MIQYAILFHKDNAEQIAAELDYVTTETLLEEYNHMLESHGTVVLFKDLLDNGTPMLNGVIYPAYFRANFPGIELNDKTFTETNRF